MLRSGRLRSGFATSDPIGGIQQMTRGSSNNVAIYMYSALIGWDRIIC